MKTRCIELSRFESANIFPLLQSVLYRQLYAVLFIVAWKAFPSLNLTIFPVMHIQSYRLIMFESPKRLTNNPIIRKSPYRHSQCGDFCIVYRLYLLTFFHFCRQSFGNSLTSFGLSQAAVRRFFQGYRQ